MKNLVKILLPIFNAYICLFGFVGIYTYAGGKISDEVGLLFFPIIAFMVYGAYIGYKAVK